MTTAYLPNLVIAGVGKSGTTSLFWYLSQHADICASQLKEINYFSPNRQQPAKLETYAGYFSHWAGERYRMEASPAYFYGGSAVIAQMRQVLDSPRVIISLRDPVTRLWSAYTFLKSMGRLDKELDFRSYIDDCERQMSARAEGSNTQDHTPLSVGFYDEYLQPWFDSFGDDLRIVFADNLFSRPQSVITNLSMWLDIDPPVAGAIDYRAHNRTVAPRNHRLARWAYGARSVSDNLFRNAPAARRLLRNVYAAVNDRGNREALEPETRQRLQELYAASNAATARALTVRGYTDLPPWLTAH